MKSFILFWLIQLLVPKPIEGAIIDPTANFTGSVGTGTESMAFELEEFMQRISGLGISFFIFAAFIAASIGISILMCIMAFLLLLSFSF